LIVADEFHKAANRDSQRSQALELIVKGSDWLWGLTGTAVRKRPRNILNLLRLINHPLVNTDQKAWKFLTRYCGVFLEGLNVWDFDQAHNLEELHELLRDTLIRREKDQTNLPPKVRVVRKLHLTSAQQEAYEAEWEAYKNDARKMAKLQGMKGGHQGGVKRKIQQMSAAMVKVPAVVEWAEELIDEGEKVVIFTDVTDVWKALMKHFGDKAVGINGSVTDKNRKLAKDSFQKDPKVMVFVGNIIAAGESITLTASSHLGFVDITRVPGDQLQAEDRIHRGGAISTCMIYYFLAVGTQDEHIFKDFVRSKEVVEAITARRRDGEVKQDAQWTGDIEGLVTNKVNKLELT